ncbi:sugar phosphate nucleotidyltransferase [Streptomyces sp. NPDC051109]|uniref:sugar phosphate nucleotidyltransferase n=1 Tax=Streptomyces sp. NPDC051109 TaxID=3365642 RepID=UPI003799ACA7
MKAFILAAGLGERLRPLTGALPKPLVPVFNRPVIGHVIDALFAAGCTEIGVNVHAFPDKMTAYLTEHRADAGRLSVFHEEELLGSVGTIRRCREFFADGPVLVTCADIISTTDFAGLIAQHMRRRPAVTMAGVPVTADWSGDYVETSDGISVRSFSYKPGKPVGDSVTGCFGTWIAEPGLLDGVAADAFDVSRDVLTALPSGARTMDVFEDDRVRLCDVGQYELLHLANTKGIEGVFRTDHRAREAAPGVYDQGDTDLGPAAVVTGPVLLGREVVLGDGCELSGPLVVGHRAVIGAGARVVDSVLLPGCAVPDGALVENTVYGDPAAVWPAMVANLF